MSIIAGIIRFDGGPAEISRVESMTDWMKHCAPDGIAHWHGHGAALGAGLLRTTPESLEEIQPLANEDQSLVLVMDGRVDNWEELRAELLETGAILRTKSDAELVLRAFERWGQDCLNHIDGEFALVIWDARKHQAFCARDRLGVKPFYYHFNGKLLSFATMPRTLLDLPWVGASLNEGMALEFLGSDWCNTDETFWQGVMRLPPSRSMTVDERTCSVSPYWFPDTSEFSEDIDDAACEQRYLQLLSDAVRRLSRSYQPLAFEVSGGLDSSALFSVAEHLRRDGRLLTPEINAYTLHFDPATAANDLPYARAVGELLGVEIEEVEPTFRSLEWSEDEARRTALFPSFPNGTMGLDIRVSAAARGSHVLVVGIGADEQLSSGRGYYAKALRSMDLRHLFLFFREDARVAGKWRAGYWLLRHGIYRILPKPIQQLALKLVPSRTTSQGHKPENWLIQEANERLVKRIMHTPVDPLRNKNEILDSLLNPYGIWAREQEVVMAAGQRIELRYPFLYRPLVEFTIRLPAWQRIRGNLNKSIHRRAMKGYLPQQLLERQIKADFTLTFEPHVAPLRQWLECNWEDAGLGRWIRRSALKSVEKDAMSIGFGGWSHFMLWSLFGCGFLARRVSEWTKKGNKDE